MRYQIEITDIWRIVMGERIEVSRQVLLRIGTLLVLDKTQSDKVIAMANQLWDAVGTSSSVGDSGPAILIMTQMLTSVCVFV